MTKGTKDSTIHNKESQIRSSKIIEDYHSRDKFLLQSFQEIPMFKSDSIILLNYPNENPKAGVEGYISYLFYNVSLISEKPEHDDLEKPLSLFWKSNDAVTQNIIEHSLVNCRQLLRMP